MRDNSRISNLGNGDLYQGPGELENKAQRQEKFHVKDISVEMTPRCLTVRVCHTRGGEPGSRIRERNIETIG